MVPKQNTNDFTLPQLGTLDQPPSWCNSRGGLDRSACVEIRVSEIRRLFRCVIPNGKKRPDGKGRNPLVKPLPNERPARNVHGRIATGIFTIRARHIDRLHARRQPRELGGDFRTPRAPVMQLPYHSPDGPYKCRINRSDPIAWPRDRGLDGNPNKGAGRTKKIGLYEEWSQPVRMEKWIFPDRIRPAYYFICPGMFLHTAHPPHGRRAPKTDPRLPPLSTCKAGRKATGCPQRTLKLMLVQCTEQESSDAIFAQTWIESLPPRVAARLRPEIHRLIARYGPIMEPRTLLCPRCLGVHYGNNPETIRQGWRRRNHRPDFTVRNNLFRTDVR